MTADDDTEGGVRMPEGFKDSSVVVLGGAGFLGSHLCDRLVGEGARVTAVDNFITGDPDNVAHLVGRSGFTLVSYDVTDYLHVRGPVDHILHFASPASPVDYLRHPIQTLKVGSLGTHKALGLARAKGARFLLASTSEVYGDPQVNPQPETYWGNVNPIGPRGVYDEAKRFAEAITLAYHREHNVDVRIVRIFNSILADEQVLYDDGRELRREPVHELARRRQGGVDLVGYQVPAFGTEGRIESSTTTALVGHPTSAPCFRVSTGYGRSLRVTGDHSLFVEGEDGRPVARPVSQLLVGQRVAIAGRVDVPERDRTEVRLSRVWREAGGDPWGVVVRSPGFGAVVWEHRAELIELLSSRRGATTGPVRQSTWGEIVNHRQRNQLPLGALQRLGIPIPDDATIRLRTAGRAAELPERIPVTDELLWLLGLYVAEGGRYQGPKSDFLHFSADPQLLGRAAKVIERDLGLHVVRGRASAARAPSIFVHGKLLLLLMDALGFSPGSKRIPGWVLGLPLARLKWFIEGYREGDGVHSRAKFAEGIRHEFSTISEYLKDDLVVAFARFGLVPSVGHETTFRQKTGDRRYPFWRLTLCHVDPWSPLEWDRGVAQVLQARRFGDLVWAPVTSIDEVPSTPLVYDFCVPGRENFWAGTGVMAHNTYGPSMRVADGRAVPAFFAAALRGEPLPVQGDGLQTRSLCYVDDLVEGILRLQLSDTVGPVNIGNPQEVTILQLAEAVQEAVQRWPGVEFHPRVEDDPMVRRPDTRLAESALGWTATVDLAEGLRRTAPWFRQRLGL